MAISIEQFQLEGKKVFLRADLNVPFDDNFNITDTTRIDAVVPTIELLRKKGAAVILATHLGRPKNGPEDKFSTRHLVSYISKKLGTTIIHASDCIGGDAEAMAMVLQAGEVLLLENVRFYSEETKGDKSFAKELASLADVYVNDAFGTAHRAHASTAIIAENFGPNEKAFGLLMGKEVENGSKILNKAEAPFTAIVGGAKVSDKILILENLLEKADNIIIGGGMAYTFFRAQGGSIGNSLVEADRLETAKAFLEKAENKGVNVFLPEDSLAASAFAADADFIVCNSNEIPEGRMGLDIGEKARALFSSVVESSKTILWNGPMGVAEMDAFANGTLEIGKAVAKATANGAFSLVGGGDSVAAVNKLQIADSISFISTGGGAMLEFLEGKTLPGIAAIEEN